MRFPKGTVRYFDHLHLASCVEFVEEIPDSTWVGISLMTLMAEIWTVAVSLKGAHGNDRDHCGGFRIGVIFKFELAREKAAITHGELANRPKTKNSAKSRIEIHAEDIKLSNVEKRGSALSNGCCFEFVEDIPSTEVSTQRQFKSP